MKRSIIFFLIITLSISVLHSQVKQDHSYCNRDFDIAKELFFEKQYSVSYDYFQRVLQTPQLEADVKAEAEYYIAANSYYLKRSDALDVLETYLEKYPYTPMRSKVYYMVGRLYYDKKNYSETLKKYGQVRQKQLDKSDVEDYLFSMGYSQLMLKQYPAASKTFKSIKEYGHPYTKDAEYYYAYSEFCQKNYKPSLESFINIDESSKYYEAAQFHSLQIYDQIGYRSEAVKLGKELLSKYPKSKYKTEAYRILGENSYHQQNWDDVIIYLSKYANSEEKIQRSDMYMLGIAYYMKQKYSNAIGSLGRVTTEQDSLSQNAYIFIGHSYLKLNQPSNARMAFQNCSQQSFDKKLQEEALYNYALATYESKAPFGETIKAFEKFIEKYPKSSHSDDILERMADAYISDKNYAEALKSISKISNLTPKLIQAKEQALFQMGVSEFQKNNFAEAQNWFTQSIDLYTKNSFSSQAYLWRGECYYRTNEPEKAQQDIKTFLETPQRKTANQLYNAYYTMGYINFEAKKYNTSLPYFIKYTEIENAPRTRQYPDVTNRIGDCYFNQRNFEKAKEYYSKTPSTSPVADYAMYQNAFILGLQKKYDQKIKTLTTLATKYPNGDYADDAYYEIGRTYVVQEKNNEAINAYRKLQKQHPQSILTRKASLEIGMLYSIMGQNNNAIQSYKYVVEQYPTSEETRVALESLKNLYIEENRVDEYLAYRETMSGSTISTMAHSEEDSISFLAAEKVFARGEYEKAITSLNNYIYKYCENQSSNCISAQYYLAESYYNLKKYDKALLYYDKLTSLEGNTYYESALLRASGISYDMKNFNAAKDYFEMLLTAASNSENRAIARLGVLRCSYFTDQYQSTIYIANEIINDVSSDVNTIREARYNRAKAYIAINETSNAVSDLKELSTDISYETGAESKYLLAQYYFDNNDRNKAEKLINEFIEEGTSHQYWVARCLLLYSDIYLAKGDLFSAKQFLLSIQENYNADDDIQTLTTERINIITEKEQEGIIK